MRRGPGGWGNLTGAETAPDIAGIDVREDWVQVRLESASRDLELFQEFLPDDWPKDPGEARPPLPDRPRISVPKPSRW